MGRLWVSLAAACCLAMPIASSGQQAGDMQAVQRLAAALVTRAREVPTGSEVRLYEAQFALLVDTSPLECRWLLDAIKLARGTDQLPVNAGRALDELYNTMAACRRGTGAGPDAQGFALFGTGIDFASGGGSDYAS